MKISNNDILLSNNNELYDKCICDNIQIVDVKEHFTKIKRDKSYKQLQRNFDHDKIFIQITEAMLNNENKICILSVKHNKNDPIYQKLVEKAYNGKNSFMQELVDKFQTENFKIYSKIVKRKEKIKEKIYYIYYYEVYIIWGDILKDKNNTKKTCIIL